MIHFIGSFSPFASGLLRTILVSKSFQTKLLLFSELGDFLKGLYPLTYKRKFPDGRIVTMNADTNEEIPE